MRFASRPRDWLDVLLLGSCLAGAALTSRAADWDLGLLAVLAATAAATSLLMVQTGGVKFTGASLPIGLACVMSGPAPAAALGLGYALLINWQLRRWRDLLLNQLAAYATFSLAGALSFEQLVAHGLVVPGRASFLAGVIAVVLGANVLNFVLIASDGSGSRPLRVEFIHGFVPMVPWLVVSAALLAGTAHAYLTLGLAPVVGFGVVLVVSQALLYALVKKGTRADRLSAERDVLLAETVEAESRERHRMAAELHDDALQTLLAARQDAREAAEGDMSKLARAEAGVAQAIGKLRRTMATLNLEDDRQDLCAGLAGLTRLGEWSPGLVSELHVDSSVGRIHDPVMAAIARELFTNVVKHAHASTAAVFLTRTNGRLILEVRDDGVGLDPLAVSEPAVLGHIGLDLVRRRATARGGLVDIRSSVGEGTAVRVELPMPSSN